MTVTTKGGSALTLAASARTIQLAIRARLLQDVARLWPLLDPKRLDETFPGWMRAMTILTRDYRSQSSAAASAAYRAARQQATQSPAPRSLVRLAPDADEEWLSRAYGFSGPGMLRRDTARPNTALSTTMGTASRIVLDAGQTTTLDTLLEDPVALGWYRVTDSAPCAFCAMLAGRGVEYKPYGEHSFDASNARFEGEGIAKVHNDCGCTMAPAFSRDQELPETSRRAAEVYRNRGDGDALVAFRKAWNAHLASQP